MAAAATGDGSASKQSLWQYQDDLPSLPVPALEDTMRRFLKSAEVFLIPEELQHTKAVIADFQRTRGPELQAILEDRASDSRNWIEQWWEEYAYLMWREPIAVNVNFYGVLPGSWGAQDLTQAQSAGVVSYFLLRFRQKVLDGTLQPEKMAGQPLCMAQYRRMFSVCRVPGEHTDELVEWEPRDYRHIIVLLENKFYAFDVLDKYGNIMSPDQLTIQFQRVLQEGVTRFEFDQEAPLSKLTGTNRTKWAQAREHLQELDPTNAKNLDLIEKAVFHVSLDQTTPAPDDLAARARACLHGDGSNKWFDKPVTLVQFKNGKGGTNGEHTWADAMVVVRAFDLAMEEADEHISKYGPPRLPTAEDLAATDLVSPTRVTFKLDTHLQGAIEEASADLFQLVSTVDLDVVEFNHFGKGFFKRYRLIADSVCQMAIQLAWARLHPGEVAATYESAHTRLFYHGRTETIRTTCKESIAFTDAMCSKTATDKEKHEALQAAMSAHRETAKDALLGQGVDRHFLGLYVAAVMSGMDPLPSLFTDKAFLASRKYRLSTSNISMKSSPMFGGFMAMHEDGYGICYSMRDELLKFSVTANNKDPNTSASRFCRALEQALIDIQKVCLSRSVIYVAGASKL